MVPFYSVKMHFDNILPFSLGLPSVLFPQIFPPEPPVHFILPDTCYMFQ
jgi:hypothetical protein